MKRERLLTKTGKRLRLRLIESHVTPFLNAARDYALEDWHVLPVEPRGKKPLIKDWPRQASNDLDKINAWWKKTPEANVGILTGSVSGLFVLDVDAPHGGDDALRQLEAGHGALPKTLRAATGSGHHYYFRYPHNCDIKTSANSLGPGLDVRGVGGFVVAPPSVHPNGSVYKWDSSANYLDSDVAEAPDWLINLCVRTNKPRPQTGNNDDVIFTEGHRNDNLTSLGGCMRDRGMSHEAIEAALIEENIKRCNPPLSEEEVRGIAASVSRYEPGVNQEDEAELQRLAKLSQIEYEHQRNKAAEQLGCRKKTLDEEVMKRRQGVKHVDTMDELIQGVTPWPEAVNASELLEEISNVIAKYIVLPDGAADVLTLWAAHAHVFHAFQHTPKLNITSPEPECGKTLLLDVLETLTPKALRTENVTTAVLFRLIDKESPTLLIDEYDSFLKQNVELIGALNAGHKRGGQHFRCVGDSNEVKGFKTFAPVALAGIRVLRGPLGSRSIVIQLKRARRNEIKNQFDSRHVEYEQKLNRQLARWAKDNIEQFKTLDPVLPPDMYNRQADNWRPLFAIAENVGGTWPERLKNAFILLTNNEDREDTAGVMLLKDIKNIFDDKDVDKLFSRDLVEELVALEDRPWCDWKYGKPLTQKSLAWLLKPFRISSHTIRSSSCILKGYNREEFEDAFNRYLSCPSPDTPSQNVTTLQVNNDATTSVFKRRNKKRKRKFKVHQ